MGEFFQNSILPLAELLAAGAVTRDVLLAPEVGGWPLVDYQLQMLAAFSKACGKELKHVLAEKRPGDVGTVYGATDKALAELGWKAELGLEDMCADSWRWISNNPNGFD